LKEVEVFKYFFLYVVLSNSSYSVDEFKLTAIGPQYTI